MGCYSTIKRNKALTHAITLMGSESIILSEKHQWQKDVYFMILSTLSI